MFRQQRLSISRGRRRPFSDSLGGCGLPKATTQKLQLVRPLQLPKQFVFKTKPITCSNKENRHVVLPPKLPGAVVAVGDVSNAFYKAMDRLDLALDKFESLKAHTGLPLDLAF